MIPPRLVVAVLSLALAAPAASEPGTAAAGETRPAAHRPAGKKKVVEGEEIEVEGKRARPVGEAKGKGKGKVVEAPELEVEGKIARPRSKVAPPQGSLQGELERDESFLPKVLEALGKEPF